MKADTRVLYEELRHAVRETSTADMRAWGRKAGGRLPGLLVRRVNRLGSLVTRIAHGVGAEIGAARQAWKDGTLRRHMEGRSAAAIDGGIGLAQEAASFVSAVGQRLVDDPRRTVPDVFALALGAYAGSGGLDSNGGIPDTDLALGIGWHRSLFTHSIVAGAVAEGAILALADLADIVLEKLPPGERSPFWDELAASKDRIAHQLALGTSAGIAYHLGVDALIQPAPYHGLPFNLPLEAHQAVMATNALAEGADAAARAGESSPGQRLVSLVSIGVDRVAGQLQDARKRLGWK